jgi:hypothetical protein
MAFGFGNLGAVLLAVSSAAMAQAPPPVPADPLELVTGAAQPVQDAQQRAQAIALLNNARALSNVRAQPYDLKTSFSTSGGLSSDGNWMLEDMARGRHYRWTAQGPNYSAVNLYPESVQGVLYGTQSSTATPLRLMQVRNAIFFVYPMIGPYASVRIAPGLLNGAPQNCVLVVFGAGDQTFTGARNWRESEHCVDAQTGLLTTYSPVPGMYVHYDYSSGIRFHDKVIPTGFTITQAGQTVVDAKTVSVTDPPDAKDPVFSPAGLAELGVGRVMNPPMNFRSRIGAGGRWFTPASNPTSLQMVVLHGNVAADGHLSEVEILASSDVSLNQNVLGRAKEWRQMRGAGQPGATLQSQEMILTYEYGTPGR